MSTEAVDVLEVALSASMGSDRESFLRALDSLENDPLEVPPLLQYVAAASLWNSAGGDVASPERRTEVAASIRKPESPWSRVFDQGVLEAVLDVLSGNSSNSHHIPPSQSLSALLAISAQCLSETSGRWATWQEEYRFIVANFRRRQRAAG